MANARRLPDLAGEVRRSGGDCEAGRQIFGGRFMGGLGRWGKHSARAGGLIGHRFAAAGVRVRARRSATGNCVLRETIRRVVRGLIRALLYLPSCLPKILGVVPLKHLIPPKNY